MREASKVFIASLFVILLVNLDLSSFKKGVNFITIRSKDFVTTRKIIKY